MDEQKNTTLLYDFTRAISSSVAAFRVAVRQLLPNLYLLNQSPNKNEDTLIYDGEYPNVNPHAYGEYLDRLGAMFDLTRHSGETDEEFRSRILFFLSENSTINGIKRAVKQIFLARGFEVDVDVRESIKDFFDGTTTPLGMPLRDVKGSMLYGLTIVITAAIESLSKVTRYNSTTGVKEEIIFPTGVVWNKRKNPYIGNILNAFKVSDLKYLLEDIVAAGINIDKVVVQTSGAGGNRAPIVTVDRVALPILSSDEEVDLTNVVTYDGIPVVYDGEYIIYS
jgi:hypothetical protein